MNMNNLCLAISGFLGLTVMFGLDGGAFDCCQTLMVLIPCMLLFWQSADKKRKSPCRAATLAKGTEQKFHA